MGNDGERKTNFDISKYKQQQFQQNQHHYPISNQHQQRSGLLPTDEQDAYKRSANRASRRSRAERTSYLMATGHLDPDETQRLNGHIEDTILTEPPITSPSSNTAFMQRDISDQQQTSHQGSRVSTKRSNFEQSFLDDLNRTLANSPVTSQNLKYQHGDYRSVHNTSKSSRKKDDSDRKSKRQATSKVKSIGSQSTTTENDNLGRSKFRQTYTEVALPMKTSPAFEYILKDNRRRNKRCCLWFLYSILMTICLLVIIWASIMISRSAHK